MSKFDLAGRRVLVTGASSGIGAETCRAIAGGGATVAMLARRKERLDDLASELGANAVAVPADVTDLDQLQLAVAEAVDALGGLDGVVTVAGRSMTGTVATGTPQRWRELMELNLIGPLATIRYATAHFVEAGRRDVVIVGSAGSITPMPGVGIYAATKRGLRAAFDSMRLEFAPSGVNVSLVMPGMFETEGLTIEGMIFDGDIPPMDLPVFVPGGVPVHPAPVAETIAFLMSLPDGVCINEVVIRPTGELNP